MKAVRAIVAMLLVLGTFVSSYAGEVEFPEANPFAAFNANEEQRIWNKPGNLVLEAMIRPISRATITVYGDEESTSGFLSITRGDVVNEPVTFYFNFSVREDGPRSELSFEVPERGGMWEEGFRGIAPKEDAVYDVFDQMPFQAKVLWIQPLLGGYLVRGANSEYTLYLIVGSESLNGLIVLSLGNVEVFDDVQSGRKVRVWGARNVSTQRVEWRQGDEKGKYVWRPGSELVFQPDKIHL